MSENLKAHIEYFADMTSNDARDFTIETLADEEFVRMIVKELDARSLPQGAPHALHVMAHQTRELWVAKLKRVA